MSNLPPFFVRRFDSHKFEKLMRSFAKNIYFMSNSKLDFKHKLIHNTLETYFHYKHQININDINEDEVNSITDYLIDIFGSLIDMYYSGLKKNIRNPL